MNSSNFRDCDLSRAIGMRLSVLCCVLAVLASNTASHAEETTPSQPILHLSNDSFIPGQLLDSDQPDVLRWRSRLFTKPFEFPLNGISAAQFPVVLPRPKPTGEYCIELSSGDVVYGDIVEFSDVSLRIQASNAGSIHVKRANVQRIYRWKETSLIYLGPSGLDGWGFAMPGIPKGDIWTNEGGWPRTTAKNASLFKDFGIPARSAIEFELSWNDVPDFELVLGPRNLRGIVDAVAPVAGKASIEDEFRFEVWDGELVVVGESERDADVATVTPIASGPGAVRVRLYLDQEKQRLSIFSRSGKQTASVRLHSKKPEVRGGLRITNRKGHLRLKHLRIAHWDGILPQDVQADKSRIHQTDGKIIYGQVTAFDTASKTFTVKQDTGIVEIDAATVSDVFLSPSVPAEPLDAPQNTAKTPADSLASKDDVPSGAPSLSLTKIACQDGSQFSGRLNGIQNGNVQLSCQSIDEPLSLPLDEIRSIARRRSGPQVSVTSSDLGRGGRLELDGVRLRGRLLDGVETADASCLVWHPDFSSNASPMLKGLSGRIVYRDPPKPVTKVNVPRLNQRVVIRQINRKPVIQGFGAVFTKMLTGKIAPAKKPKFRSPQTLHLRSGDTIPCEVVSVDNKGLHFTTPLSDATFISNSRIKSVELDGKLGAPTLDETKRTRLLTLPRLQKGSPPTHLIYSVNGDFLRGRLVDMTETMLTVEVRLTNRQIPRDRVSQLIWLHADELEPQDPSADVTAEATADQPKPTKLENIADAGKEPSKSKPTRVQTLVRHKDRLTFLASKVEDSLLSGSSDILGECRSEIGDCDQLLFGDFIEQAAAKLAYHRWKLHHATEPKFVLAGDDDGGGPPITGTESPLVGQPAPDFKLADLKGNDFQLAEHRGEIIVLDFWATWCSPCLQTMPLVDEIVREFPDQKVRLLAVNMEEQPAEIKSTLERHKLDVPVILDIDGVAAARYSVTSIPQTVVIDREGNVSRLFIGGGPKLAEPLRQALKELTNPQPTPEDAATSQDANAK
ncbi:MAG: TlpA family protein disulfide reductase [Planctomycetales bacterium]|jgi:thiol-disulfide isomerase/thioredoxin